MSTRWAIAAVAALALAVTTLAVPLPWLDRGGEAHEASPAGPACQANAKPANLNFTLKDLDNRAVSLASFKGKVIVLDFWATWCVPCKAEIPAFVDLQNRYGKQGLQVVGISVDDKLEQLKPYVASMKMNYVILQGLDHDDVQDAFGPMWGIPTTVVIARDGTICNKHIGISSKEAFEREIKSLL